MSPTSICRFIVRFHKPVLLLLAVLTATSVYLLATVGLKEDYRLEAFVASGDESYVKFQAFVEEFTSNEFAVVALHSTVPFDDSIEAMLVELTEQLQSIESVQECSSIASIPRPLRVLLGDRIYAHPLLEGSLISTDRRTVAILLQMSAEHTEGEVRRRTVEEMRQIIAAFRFSHPTMEVFLTGPYVTLIDMYAHVNQDLLVFSVLAFVLIVVTLWAVFRRLAPMVFAGGIALSAIALTLGLTIALGLVTSLITQMVVILVVVLSVANCVHLAIACEDTKRDDDVGSTSVGVLSRMLGPCSAVMSTTAVGFGSVCISQISPVNRFGALMVFGLSVALIGSLAAVPVLVRRGNRPGGAPSHHIVESILSTSARLALARRTQVLVGFAVLTGVMVLGGSRVTFQSDFIKNFRANSEIRRSYNFIEKHLTPLGSAELIIRRRDGTSMARVDAIDSASNVAASLVSSLPMVRRSLTLADAISLTSPGRPQTTQHVALSLGLLRSIPGGRSILQNFLNDSEGAMRINFRCVEGFDVREKLTACATMKSEAEQTLGRDYEVEVTGLYHFYAMLVSNLLRDQYRSFAIATVCIAIVLALILRGWKLLFILLLVNFMPVVFCVGVMGWFNIPVNMTAAMMLSVTLGIAVDDSIHYVWRLKREHAMHGDLVLAIQATHRSVGRACLFTTIVIACGFSILLFSRFLPTAYFGGLLAVTMLAALAADLWLLPALVLTLRPFEKRESASS
ncbi:MAG: MMPL family transporter [Planctomycetes bacterium]|nr:MMPL family transporter [Planctomycetota bacterium]